MINNNYCIILAGGIGSKLWPMSHTTMPKQFLDLFSTGRTMLQMTFDRYAKLVPVDNIYISTFKDYVSIVKEQLPEIPEEHIVSEPIQISTAPSTALSLMYIMQRNPKANVISAPADQLVFDNLAFEEQMKKGLDYVSRCKQFVAIGIKPTRPATSYGYLQASEEVEGFLKLKSFTEKPNRDFAKLFCESGEFYWNTGIFLWNLETMLDAMKDSYPDLEKMTKSLAALSSIDATRIVTEQYPRIRFQSIDLLILQHNDNVLIEPCTFGWADVGSWKNFYDLQQKDADGNVTGYARSLLYDCKDTLVNVSDNKVVILQDLEGYMVVENDKMLMVCKKDDPAQIRRIMNDAQMKFGEEVS